MPAVQNALHFILVEGTLLVVLYYSVTLLVTLTQQYAVGQRALARLAGLPPARGALWAAVAGALTPFCSCSTVPVLAGLLRAGVAFATALTFLVASPVINEGVLLLFLLSGDVTSAVAFTLIAAVLSVGLGLAAAWAGFGRYVVAGAGGMALDDEGPLPTSLMPAAASPTHRMRLTLAAMSAGWELKRAAPWLAAGILVGGLLYGFLPEAWFASLTGRVPEALLIPLVATLAVPFYLSPSMVVPLGLALVAKGMPVGALVALIVAGVGTSAPELVMLGRLFRLPLLIAYVLAMVLVASALGFAMQWVVAMPAALI